MCCCKRCWRSTNARKPTTEARRHRQKEDTCCRRSGAMSLWVDQGVLRGSSIHPIAFIRANQRVKPSPCLRVSVVSSVCLQPIMPSMSIADNVAAVRERIARAAARVGRNPESVTLMAVSKTVEPERIREAYAAGIRVFGENRVQEFSRKGAGARRPQRRRVASDRPPAEQQSQEGRRAVSRRRLRGLAAAGRETEPGRGAGEQDALRADRDQGRRRRE